MSTAQTIRPIHTAPRNEDVRLAPDELAAIREYADQKGKEHAETVFAQQVDHSRFWRRYLAGEIELPLPSYDSVR